VIDSLAQEQKHQLHHIDWPVFLSAEQRQKLLYGKLQRAIQALGAHTAIPNRNANARSGTTNTGSNQQHK
jgi:hypothetical protein